MLFYIFLNTVKFEQLLKFYALLGLLFSKLPTLHSTNHVHFSIVEVVFPWTIYKIIVYIKDINVLPFVLNVFLSRWIIYFLMLRIFTYISFYKCIGLPASGRRVSQHFDSICAITTKKIRQGPINLMPRPSLFLYLWNNAFLCFPSFMIYSSVPTFLLGLCPTKGEKRGSPTKLPCQEPKAYFECGWSWSWGATVTQ